MTVENWNWVGVGVAGTLVALAVGMALKLVWTEWRGRQKRRHGAGLVWDQALHKRIGVLMGIVDDTNKRMESRRLDVDARIETWAKTGEDTRKEYESLAKCVDEGLARGIAIQIDVKEADVRMESLASDIRKVQDMLASVKRENLWGFLVKRVAELENVGNVSDALGSRLAGLETSFFGDRGRHALLMGRVEALETRRSKTKPTKASK